VHVYCFLTCYVVAMALEWSRLHRPSNVKRVATLLAMTVGFVAQTIYLFDRARVVDLPPLLNSTHDWLLVLGWMVVLLFLFLSVLDRRLGIGLFLIPLVLILVSASAFVTDLPSRLATNQDREVAIYNWAMLHVSLLAFGFIAAVVGLMVGLMYLVQHRRLKHRQAERAGLSLPSLEKLERMNWLTVMISIPLLMLGMLIGIGLGWYSKTTPTPFDFGEPMVIVIGSLWVVLAVFFCWLRWTRRPAAKQVAWLTIWAFGFLLVTLLGLLVLTGGHSNVQQSADVTHVLNVDFYIV